MVSAPSTSILRMTTPGKILSFHCSRMPILTTVDYALKQYQTLCHTILTSLLQQHLVVLAQRDTEDDTRHRLEAVDPLLSL